MSKLVSVADGSTINNAAFRHLIRWADDGLSGLIPDKKQVSATAVFELTVVSEQQGWVAPSSPSPR